MKNHIVAVLLIILSYSVSYVYSSCGQIIIKNENEWSNKKNIVISLFSFTSFNNKTLFDLEAYVINDRIYNLLNVLSSLPVQFATIDVCNDINVLTESLLTLLLDSRFQKTVIIISYVSNDLTKRLLALMLPTDVIVSAYSTTEIDFGNLYEILRNQQRYFLWAKIEDLTSALVYRNVFKFVYIIICEEEKFCKETLRNIYSVTREETICLKYKIIIGLPTYKEFEGYISNMSLSNSPKYIQETGSNSFIDTLDSYYRRYPNPIKTNVTIFKNHIFNLTNTCLGIIPDSSRIINTSQINSTRCVEFESFTESNELFSLFRLPFELLYWHFVYGVTLKNLLIDLFQISNSNLYPWKPQSCIVQSCDKGTESFYGTLSNQRFYNSVYDWDCQQCKNNSIKETKGYNLCNDCPLDWRSNTEKTLCYDPYKEKYFSLESEDAIILLTIGISCIVIITSIVAVLVKYRNTPIITASDKKLITIQCLSHFLLSVAIPVLYYGKPTPKTCLSRPFITSVLLTIPVAIAISKTQKLLMIFQSKIQMDQTKVLVTSATYTFVCFVIVGLGVAVAMISTKDAYPVVVKMKLRQTLNTWMYCSNSNHVQTQLIYLFLLYICNTFQGHRARRLPSNFKDTHLLTISSLLCSIIVCTATVVFYSQEQPWHKDIVLIYTMLIVNIVHFIFLFAHKTFILIFRPEMNTHKMIHIEIKRRVDKNSFRDWEN